VILIAALSILAVEATAIGYVSLHGKDPGLGPAWIRVGSADDVGTSGPMFIDSIPAYIVATPNGLIGLYARSPQMGEPVVYCPSSGWFEDPMHGSKFDGVGNYALGPAPRGLDRLEVRVVGDDVWIDTVDRILGPPRGTHGRQLGPFCGT